MQKIVIALALVVLMGTLTNCKKNIIIINVTLFNTLNLSDIEI